MPRDAERGWWRRYTGGVTFPRSALRQRLEASLREELARWGRRDLFFYLCLSDAEWRRAMLATGCPAYAARLASPTARRGTRGKLGMATICHLRHGHPAAVYVKTRGRPREEVLATLYHEALHLARPSYGHRRIEAALRERDAEGRQGWAKA
jgi:hypothetical protein